MWARVPGPTRFDADLNSGIRVQLRTSEQISGDATLRHCHNHRSSSGAAGDSESEMQLQSLQGLQQTQQLVRPGTQNVPISSQEMASMLDRVTVLLSQNPHTFSFLDSSETEDGGSSAPEGAAMSDRATSHGSRPLFSLRTALCHGHTTARHVDNAAGTLRSQSAVETRQQLPQLSMQKQLAPLQSQHHPRPPQHQQQQMHQQQHQLQAGDSKSAADAKSTASTRTRYFFESMFLRNLQFSCARVDFKFTPEETSVPIAELPRPEEGRISLQPSQLSLVFRYANSNPSRPVCTRLRNLRSQEAAPTDAACQTEFIESPMELSKPLPPARSKSRCHSTVTSQRSRWERRQPHAGEYDQAQEEVENDLVGHQKMRSFRPAGGCDGTGDNGRATSSVLRSVGRHLNSFFCPGTCGRSENQSGVPQASTILLEPPNWHTAGIYEPSRYLIETARRVTEPTGTAYRTSAATHSRRLEKTCVLTGELPSPNSSLSRETPPLKDKRKQRKRQSPPSTESTSRVIAESWGPECGSGFDSLVRTLDRARQRMGASTCNTGATSPASYRSTATSYQRQPPKSPPAPPPPPPQQPQLPARERCRFHTCEVACEVCSLAEERDEAEEEVGNWQGGNQSNAGCSKTCICALDKDYEDDTCLVASVELVEGESTVSEECNCKQYSKHQLLIGSLERCLTTLSQDMRVFLRRIKGSTAELQRLRDLN